MLKQQLQLKLSQKLSPQQIQLMKLMQLSTLDFEQRLQYEIEQNPALEKGKEIKDQDDNTLNNEFEEDFSDSEDVNIDNYLTDDEVPNYKLNSKNYTNEEDEKTIPISGEIGFHQLLKNQISSLILNKKETLIAEFIIGSIDDSGYIRRSKQDLIDDLAFTQNIFIEEKELSNILKKVQSLDPPGIGSNSLKECLSIQLSR